MMQVTVTCMKDIAVGMHC